MHRTLAALALLVSVSCVHATELPFDWTKTKAVLAKDFGARYPSAKIYVSGYQLTTPDRAVVFLYGTGYKSFNFQANVYRLQTDSGQAWVYIPTEEGRPPVTVE